MANSLHKTINEVFYNKIEVKHSKFIAYIVPYRLFEEYKKELKEQNPKASHIVYALRRLNGNQIEEAFSDDGEPKGCAGMPVLKVLRGENIIESAVLIVRYFGGVKLGTGGMVRAYTKATLDLLEKAPLIEYIPKETITILTPYDEIRQIEYICKNSDIEILSRDFNQDSVKWQLRGAKEDISKLSNYT